MLDALYGPLPVTSTSDADPSSSTALVGKPSSHVSTSDPSHSGRSDPSQSNPAAPLSSIANPDLLLPTALVPDMSTLLHPELVGDNLHDHTVFSQLTSSQIMVQRLLALEAEVVERESWNFDASAKLIEVADEMGRIPFGTASEIFDLQPTMTSAKGKERAAEQPPQGEEKRSIFHLFPKDAKASWVRTPGKSSVFISILLRGMYLEDILPPLPLPNDAETFEQFLAQLFPGSFGPRITHNCVYRTQLVQEMKQRFTKEESVEILGTSSVSDRSFCLTSFVSISCHTYGEVCDDGCRHHRPLPHFISSFNSTNQTFWFTCDD
jgi:hypothetical protein